MTIFSEKKSDSKRSSIGHWCHFVRVGIIVIVLGIFLLLSYNTLAKPLIMDEMEFPAVARAIVETGKPIYYRGETLPQNQGLWHPPLYILIYAFWQRLFGISVISSRAFGMFNTLLAITFVAVFSMRRWKAWGQQLAHQRFQSVSLFIGLLIAATSPLLIQGSMLPDIDTQILPLSTIIMFLILFELRRRASERVYWLVFIGLMTIQLFAKLTTPLLLVPSFMVFELVRILDQQVIIRYSSRHGQRKTSSLAFRLFISLKKGWTLPLVQMLLVILGAILSLLLMLAIWYIIATLWNVSFTLPFLYLTQSSNNPANFSAGQSVIAVILAGIPANFIYVVQWFSYPALLFLLLMIVREFTCPKRGLLYLWERAALYTFLILLILMYIILKPAPFMFPKYYPPLIIPLAILGLDLLFSLLHEQHAKTIISLLIVEICLYLLYIAIRPSTAGRDFIYAFYTEWPKDPLVNMWMLQPLAFATLIGIGVWATIRVQPLNTILVGVLAVTLGWQINVAVQQAQAPYSTTYHYGENSLAAITDYLRSSLPDGALIIAPKDLGSRLQDRWPYIELTADPRTNIKQEDVEYIVMRKNDYYGNSILNTPEIAVEINNMFEKVAEVENFVVMHRR